MYEKIICPFVHLSIKSLSHHEHLSFILLHNAALRQVSLPLSIACLRKLKMGEVRRHRLTITLVRELGTMSGFPASGFC